VSSVNESLAQQQRTEAIFHKVLAADAGRRAALITELCVNDAALTEEVQLLIEASEAEEMLSVRLSAEARFDADSIHSGRGVGPYHLDRLLGRGGMGAVYLAHRVDGEFQQQVAIKLIDFPLATNLFRESFRMERQILAGLVHPYIARLLDGGVSSDGELYLAMEYVDGISIVRFCKENRLSLRARLLLFGKVCEAVHYAHQNLVIHRDLKPDNILVVADGTPRLLDFGTAKLLTPLPSSSEFTQRGLQSFTPQYASPEQVMGRPITTASDIYSLGALLYLMLAEVPPYEVKESTTETMLRVICAEEPPKPSAVAVSPEPPDADLDAIVLKALRKEPRERYISADQFGADVQSWLDGRPVLARRGTLRYRTEKFARRNKLALFAGGLLFASVLAGLVGILWQWRAANLERRRVEARSEDLRQLSNSLLSEIDEAVKELPGSTPVQQLIVQRVLEHLDRMAKDAAGDKVTQLDLVGAYTRLGNLQGNPYEQNIGDAKGALVSLDKAIGLAKSLQATNSKDPAVLGALAIAEKARSNVLFGISRTQESILAMRAAIDAFNLQFANTAPAPAQLNEAAGAFNGLGDQLGLPGVASLGDSAGALAAYRSALDLSRRALAIDPKFTRSSRTVAMDFSKIGDIVIQTDPAAAAAEYRQSLSAWSALIAGGDTSATSKRGLARVYLKLGTALSSSRDYKSALAAFEKAGETLRPYAAADPKEIRAKTDLFALDDNEAQSYIDMLSPELNSGGGDRARNAQRAADLLRDSTAIIEKLLGVDPGNRIWLSNLARDKVTLATLDPKNGTSMAASGIAELSRQASSADASIDVLELATSALLEVLPVSLRNSREAVHYAGRLVALDHRRTPQYLAMLAQAYRQDGQPAQAVSAANEGLARLPELAPGAPVTRTRKILEFESRFPVFRSSLMMHLVVATPGPFD
jgi:eukaryotic-like serine/threonine-protein kinase